MADWTDFPAAAFAADRSVHAGATRLYLQDNCEVAYDESGFDLDTFNSCDPNKASFLSHTPGITYDIFDEFYPMPIPVSPALAGGWRSILVDAEISMGAGAVKAYFCFFLHLDPWVPEILATGAAEGASSVILTTVAAAWGRASGTITIPEELAVIRLDDGVVSPMCWLHLSCKTDVAAKACHLRSLRLSEVP